VTELPRERVVDVFPKLRKYITYDIEQILKQEHGGNYAAALLVVVGCEIVSKLQRLKGDDEIFIERLARPYGINRHMAEDIADSLRNGLAHMFDTKFIKAGSLQFELLVSWGQRQHMTIQRDPPALFLNIRTMWTDLQRIFEEFAERLAADPNGGGEVPELWKKKRIKHTGSASIAGWKEWFAQRPPKGEPAG
jgi:hypothetical protein